MNKPSVLIAGYGIVGKNIHKEFPWADIVDPFQGKPYPKLGKWDYAFVCVPTPKLENGECDITYVREAVESLKELADIIILKSTVPPGTTLQLQTASHVSIVFSPEYFGESHHANDVEYNFVIFGGYKDAQGKAAQLYQHVRTGQVRFLFSSSATAELAKYMENSYLAMKVTFCNEFYRMAEAINVPYEALRELFVADPRVNPSHTFVYDEAPYYDSKCLAKDIPAIIHWAESNKLPASLLRSMVARNEEFKAQHHTDSNQDSDSS